VAAELERMQVRLVTVLETIGPCLNIQASSCGLALGKVAAARYCANTPCSVAVSSCWDWTLILQVQKAEDKAIQAALAAAEADYEADRQKAARRAQPANAKKVSLLPAVYRQVLISLTATRAAF
jgi:hypothetical protein